MGNGSPSQMHTFFLYFGRTRTAEDVKQLLEPMCNYCTLLIISRHSHAYSFLNGQMAPDTWTKMGSCVLHRRKVPSVAFQPQNTNIEGKNSSYRCLD